MLPAGLVDIVAQVKAQDAKPHLKQGDTAPEALARNLVNELPIMRELFRTYNAEPPPTCDVDRNSRTKTVTGCGFE